MRSALVRSRAIAVLPVLSLLISACGGGGDDASTTIGGAASPASPASAASAASPASGVSAASALQPTRYALFKAGSAAALPDAGAVTMATATGGTLALGGVDKTTLTVVGSDFGLSAANAAYDVVTRFDGGVVMLCDARAGGALPGTGRSRYMAVSIASAGASTQASAIASAADLAGQTLYAVEDCSYVNAATGDAEGQSSAHTSATLNLTFEADGSASSNDGTRLTATVVAELLAGRAMNIGSGAATGKLYLSAYRFTVASQPRALLVMRGVLDSGGGFVSAYLPN